MREVDDLRLALTRIKAIVFSGMDPHTGYSAEPYDCGYISKAALEKLYPAPLPDRLEVLERVAVAAQQIYHHTCPCSCCMNRSLGLYDALDALEASHE